MAKPSASERLSVARARGVRRRKSLRLQKRDQEVPEPAAADDDFFSPLPDTDSLAQVEGGAPQASEPETQEFQTARRRHSVMPKSESRRSTPLLPTTSSAESVESAMAPRAARRTPKARRGRSVPFSLAPAPWCVLPASHISDLAGR